MYQHNVQKCFKNIHADVEKLTFLTGCWFFISSLEIM